MIWRIRRELSNPRRPKITGEYLLEFRLKDVSIEFRNGEKAYETCHSTDSIHSDSAVADGGFRCGNSTGCHGSDQQQHEFDDNLDFLHHHQGIDRQAATEPVSCRRLLAAKYNDPSVGRLDRSR